MPGVGSSHRVTSLVREHAQWQRCMLGVVLWVHQLRCPEESCSSARSSRELCLPGWLSGQSDEACPGGKKPGTSGLCLALMLRGWWEYVQEMRMRTSHLSPPVLTGGRRTMPRKQKVWGHFCLSMTFRGAVQLFQDWKEGDQHSYQQ